MCWTHDTVGLFLMNPLSLLSTLSCSWKATTPIRISLLTQPEAGLLASIHMAGLFVGLFCLLQYPKVLYFSGYLSDLHVENTSLNKLVFIYFLDAK